MKTRLVLATVALAVLSVAQNSPPAITPDASVALQGAAVRALTFDEGNAASLNKSRQDFTKEGWDAYIKTLKPFLDASNAPTFTSRFAPAANGAIVRQENGRIFLRIPGTLTQTSRGSKTTYRLRLEVKIDSSSLKIDRLEQVTCTKPRSDSYCM